MNRDQAREKYEQLKEAEVLLFGETEEYHAYCTVSILLQGVENVDTAREALSTLYTKEKDAKRKAVYSLARKDLERKKETYD